MKSILKYVLKNALRDRLYIGIALLLVCAFAVAIFLGSTAASENTQTTAAFAAGAGRVIINLGIILFVCLNVARAFENKELEFILSKAVSREKFILGYLSGFFIASFIIFSLFATALFLLTSADLIGTLIWLLSLALELLIVICFSLLAALILKNPLSAIMASCGFYFLSRLMGIFILSLENLQIASKPILIYAIKIISLIFPRLDLFAQSAWINYAVQDYKILTIIAAQSLIYTALLIFMSFFDFKRKQF